MCGTHILFVYIFIPSWNVSLQRHPRVPHTMLSNFILILFFFCKFVGRQKLLCREPHTLCVFIFVEICQQHSARMLSQPYSAYLIHFLYEFSHRSHRCCNAYFEQRCLVFAHTIKRNSIRIEHQEQVGEKVST